MNKLKTTSGIGAGIALGCCFGLLNVIFGLLGLTAALAAVNRYGDYVFFPAYSFFATLFVWSLLRGRKNWYAYVIGLIGLAIGIYFMVFGLVYASLIIGGAVLGGIVIQWLKRR